MHGDTVCSPRCGVAQPRRNGPLRTITVSESSSDDEIAAAKLFLEMKKEALARSAPDPRADPRWTHEWLERDGALR